MLFFYKKALFIQILNKSKTIIPSIKNNLAKSTLAFYTKNTRAIPYPNCFICIHGSRKYIPFFILKH
jgi:hypothetical protein